MREHSAALNRLSDSTCSLGAHFAPVWQRPGAEAPQMRASRAPGRLESPRPREVCAGGRRCAARDAALELPRATHHASPAGATAELLARRAASTLPPSSQSPRAAHHASPAHATRVLTLPPSSQSLRATHPASPACASAELLARRAANAPRFACMCIRRIARWARGQPSACDAPRFACRCNRRGAR